MNFASKVDHDVQLQWLQTIRDVGGVMAHLCTKDRYHLVKVCKSTSSITLPICCAHLESALGPVLLLMHTTNLILQVEYHRLGALQSVANTQICFSSTPPPAQFRHIFQHASMTSQANGVKMSANACSKIQDHVVQIIMPITSAATQTCSRLSLLPLNPGRLAHKLALIAFVFLC